MDWYPKQIASDSLNILVISIFYYFWLLQASQKPWMYGAISSQTPVNRLNQLKQVHVQMYNIWELIDNEKQCSLKETALSGSYASTELKWINWTQFWVKVMEITKIKQK